MEGGSLLTESSLVGRSADRPALVLASTFVVSKAFLQDVVKNYEGPAAKKAEEIVKKKGIAMGVTRSESGAAGAVAGAAALPVLTQVRRRSRQVGRQVRSKGWLYAERVMMRSVFAG